MLLFTYDEAEVAAVDRQEWMQAVWWKQNIDDDYGFQTKHQWVYWLYAFTGKAARDMMFLTMAVEQPHILVLNYAPGPIDTAMQVEARTKTGDPELKAMFQSK